MSPLFDRKWTVYQIIPARSTPTHSETELISTNEAQLYSRNFISASASPYVHHIAFGQDSICDSNFPRVDGAAPAETSTIARWRITCGSAMQRVRKTERDKRNDVAARCDNRASEYAIRDQLKRTYTESYKHIRFCISFSIECGTVDQVWHVRFFVFRSVCNATSRTSFFINFS